MATKRQIETRLRKDTYIKNLKANEKLLFVYLLTNIFTNIAGVYEIGIEEMTVDTKLHDRQVKDILEKFEKDGKIVYKNNWVYIKNFIKYQSKNPSIIQGIIKETEMIPKWFLQEIDLQIPEMKEDKYTKAKKKITKKYIVDNTPKPVVDKERAKADILKFKNK